MKPFIVIQDENGGKGSGIKHGNFNAFSIALGIGIIKLERHFCCGFPPNWAKELTLAAKTKRARGMGDQ